MSAHSTKHASTGEALAPQPVDLEVAAEALKGINARLSEALSDAVDADVVSGLTTAIAAIDFAVRRMVQIRHRDPEEALAADPTYGMADRHALADTRDVMAEERTALADARDQNQGPAASDRRAASRDRAASAGDRAAEAADAPVDAGMPRGDRAHNQDNPALIPDPLVRSAVRLRHGEAIEDAEELQRIIQELTTLLALEVRRAEDAERRLAEANPDY